MWKLSDAVFVVLAISFPVIFSFPHDGLMQEQNDDTALVESTIREARAVRPETIHDLVKPGVKEAYIHTYGDEPGAEGNVHGYLKKMNDKGDDGYKHFDSYHKKDADKYGFEVHSEFGKLDKANVDTAKGQKEDIKEENNEDDVEESKKTYKVVEEPDGVSSYYGSEESGDSQNYADGESEVEGDDEGGAESSSYTDGGDGDDSYDEEEKSSYSSSSDDGDGESEGYSEDSDD